MKHIKYRLRLEQVYPILLEYLSTYDETKCIRFSTVEQDAKNAGESNRIGLAVKALCVVWMLVLLSVMIYFVRANDLVEIPMSLIAVIMLALCLVMILSVKLRKQIGEMTLYRSELRVVEQYDDPDKCFKLSLGNIDFRSKISKKSDMMRSYFILWFWGMDTKMRLHID